MAWQPWHCVSFPRRPTPDMVGDFVQQVLGGSLAPFMAYMSEASELSQEELQELKKIVQDLEAKNRKSTSRGKSK